MKKEELSNLKWIGQEIELQTKLLEELQTKAEGTGQVLDGMPKGQKERDRLASYAASIADLQNDIEHSKAVYVQEELRLKRFIEKLESSEIRLIIKLRHLQGMSWEMIGTAMGYDKSTARKKYNRFLKTSSNSPES